MRKTSPAARPSNELLRDVLALLPRSQEKGITASWVYKLLGRGTLTSVRLALNELVDGGHAACVWWDNSKGAHCYYQAPPRAAVPKEPVQMDIIDFINRSAP